MSMRTATHGKSEPAAKPDAAARIASLSPEKRALLARRLREQGSRFNLFPLSFSQQRLWFLQQLDRGSAAYNIPVAVSIDGALDAQALGASLGHVFARHESLRTTFTELNGEPMQRVLPRAPQRLRIVDVSATPARAEMLARHGVSAESRVPFELDRAPPVRATLYRLSLRRHVLLVVMHHIVSDGWSTGVLIREVAAAYEALTRGARPALPELPIQYADFAAWQRRRLDGAELERLLAYWSEQVASAKPVELPTDRPRLEPRSRRAEQRHLPLAPELAASLAAICARERTTPFGVLLAVFVALLSRWTGGTDIAVGTPVANRDRAETESLIGVFVNTLVIRTDVAGRPTVTDLVQRVRRQVLNAVAHQALPFELLVQRLCPDRGAGALPFFNVMFTYQKAPRYEEPGSALEVAPFALEPSTAKLDLTVFATDHDGRLKLSAEYDADLFDPDTIDRLLEHFTRLLRGFAERPEASVADLPMLTEAENAAARALRKRSPFTRRCVHELFEEQARSRPDAIAVAAPDGQLCYAELDDRARRLAGLLAERGLAPEEPVALCLPRSIDSVIATLAVLKAGGCYVPLDPTHPPRRLAAILAEVGATLVLCASAPEEASASFPGYGGEIWAIERDRRVGTAGQAPRGADPAAESRQGKRRGVVAPVPDSLAYVMFTSGSTGTPKGIAVPHAAIARLVRETDYVSFGPDKCFGMVANPAFDAATFELWGALANGGRVAVIPADVVLSPAELGRALREQSVTTMFLTAALFNRIVQDAPGALSVLDEVLAGGEALDPATLRTFLERERPAKVLNGYGPTETTTFATSHPIERVEPDATAVPIGRPIANTDAVVLDRDMQLAPFGATGELHIGGEGLARGYFRRPELTAQVFVPDPHSSEPGARLYRTGDLVSVRPDGAIDYRGRVDHQIKIRGFRIETAEIEAVLAKHPSVRGAVVVPFRDGSESRLAAYVTADRGASADVAGLRSFLKGRLPDYMVPAAFVTLDELPLNANGKVDRLALPPPKGAARAERGSAGEVMTPTEEMVGVAMAELLGVDHVGADDDFFELGGHSLLATQLASRIRTELKADLSVRSVFEQPTLRGLAREIDRLGRERSSLAAPIEPVDRRGPLPLSYAQRRLWFIDQLDPGNPSYNVPTAVELRGELDIAAFAAAFDTVFERHESFRTVFATRDGTPAQLVGAPPPGLCVVDLTALPAAARDREVRAVAAADALQRFDLAAGPLVTVRLLLCAPGLQVVSFSAHHIVCDEWSLGIMLRELEQAYAARIANRAPSLPALTVQPADFACWQQQHLTGEALEGLLDHWRRRLAALPVLALPCDGSAEGPVTDRGALHAFAVPPDVADALDALRRREGATMFMVLLAALDTLLMRCTGQEDIVVGTDVANRNRTELEGLVGFFVNHLLLRADLGGDPTFRQALRRVRAVCLDAYAHQDLPYDRLVADLNPGRSGSDPQLFKVLFVHGNPGPAPLALPGVEARTLSAGTVTAKYDLTLFSHQGARAAANALGGKGSAALGGKGSAADGAEGGAALGGVWRYRTDRFSAERIAWWSERFEQLVASIAANPDARLSQLDIVGAAERERRERDRLRRRTSRSAGLAAARRRGAGPSGAAGEA